MVHIQESSYNNQKNNDKIICIRKNENCRITYHNLYDEFFSLSETEDNNLYRTSQDMDKKNIDNCLYNYKNSSTLKRKNKNKLIKVKKECVHNNIFFSDTDLNNKKKHDPYNMNFKRGASHMEKNNLSSNKSDSSDKTNNSKKEKRKKKSNHNNHNNNNNNKRTDTQRKDTLNNMKYKYNNFKVNVSDFRVKDCNHISLACNRNNKYIQKNIANMYKDLKYYFLNCSWDLVMFECDENVFPQTNKQNKFLNEILRVKNFAVS
ncbi:hypothetical protein C923_02964 [Plasmodium falciparum UGT5.1]|uniref:Uncharacterized protein n=1 Tax=Plasmodium falciparum UGT5.1 TaxID=1237627 RepID=W7JBV9_PLAFA|nr:hypothetical protein C923_02964 [Plasmodium falciparum UGT5.1]